MPPVRPRPPNSVLEKAEAAFKSATTKKVEVAPAKGPAPVPGAKETISLRIDQEVLAYFQEDGPGWQDRMVAALRQAAGL